MLWRLLVAVQNSDQVQFDPVWLFGSARSTAAGRYP
jgi:hypothetical protein